MILKEKLCIVYVSWKRLCLNSIRRVIHHLKELENKIQWRWNLKLYFKQGFKSHYPFTLKILTVQNWKVLKRKQCHVKQPTRSFNSHGHTLGFQSKTKEPHHNKQLSYQHYVPSDIGTGLNLKLWKVLSKNLYQMYAVKPHVYQGMSDSLSQHWCKMLPTWTEAPHNLPGESWTSDMQFVIHLWLLWWLPCNCPLPPRAPLLHGDETEHLHLCAEG